MPNVEYALRGYNILLGNPLASGHKVPFFFTNILQAAFSLPMLCTQLSTHFCVMFVFFGKRKLAKKLFLKCWWNWLQADPGFANVIFEADYLGATSADLRYQIPDGYSLFSKTICKIDFNAETYSNEKQYHNELRVILFLHTLHLSMSFNRVSCLINCIFIIF